MGGLAVAIVIAVRPIVSIFDVVPGSAVGELSLSWIRLLGYCMPLAGVHIAFVGLLQGSGSTNTSLRINFIGTVVFQIPLSALLGVLAGQGAFGVWVAFPLSFLVKASLAYFAYRRGDWARVGVHA